LRIGGSPRLRLRLALRIGGSPRLRLRLALPLRLSAVEYSRRAVTALGLVLFVLGVLLEARVQLLGAWPSVVPWVMMSVGLVLVAVGRSRARKRRR
jgi:hypothetical protein